jgi:hypothetical protein
MRRDRGEKMAVAMAFPNASNCGEDMAGCKATNRKNLEWPVSLSSADLPNGSGCRPAQAAATLRIPTRSPRLWGAKILESESRTNLAARGEGLFRLTTNLVRIRLRLRPVWPLHAAHTLRTRAPAAESRCFRQDPERLGVGVLSCCRHSSSRSAKAWKRR